MPAICATGASEQRSFERALPAPGALPAAGVCSTIERVTAIPGGWRAECAPHTTLAGLPALFVVDCEAAAAAWRCARPVLAIRASFGKRNVLLTPTGTTFGQALEVITLTGRDHPYTFNGRDLASMTQGLCEVANLGPGAFEGARDFRVRCGDRGVVVTKACVATTCRLFPSRWDDRVP